MSIAPDSMAGALRASGPRGAPYAEERARADAAKSAEPLIRLAEVIRLQEGDRLLVHVDASAGMSAGGAHQLGMQLVAALKLDGLGFDVPVTVCPPGIRVEVVRPS